MQRKYRLWRTFLPIMMLGMLACTCSYLSAALPFPDSYYCGTLNFIEPTGSVNNGMQSFSWAFSARSTSATITIVDVETGEELSKRSADLLISATSLQQDVSEAAIGGGTELLVRLEVSFRRYSEEIVKCTREQTVTRQPLRAAAPAAPDCSAFRLTSPLGGLPNGPITFYWDPIPEATGYQINVFEGGAYLAGWSAPAGSTNVDGNVATSAIGGGYNPLTVVAIALLPEGQNCTSEATMSREAPPNNEVAPPANTDAPPPTAVPTATALPD